ncbi:MAG: arginine--tRNA ligase [Lachnospiraceae bacterium]|nr:arginine--tRNA ligase [Lachnospiraceae bacterium]
MKKFLEQISEEVMAAFAQAGYDAALGRVSVSNRPDLCKYQCNGAMAGAKKYGKKPIDIANEVAAGLQNSKAFSSVEAVMPGFLNLKADGAYLASYVEEMLHTEKYGVEAPAQPKKIVIDYGGANVAKPLHVGHLRPAIIGESIKRIARYAGHEVIGDVHLGDWGMPMGQVITELGERYPELVYFDEDYEGEYPAEAPFTIADLEEIYPTASGKCKNDEEYRKKALKATLELQQGRRGYRALWKHILNVSVTDLKKNYGSLGVDFDLWMGESDADPLIPDMIAQMKEKGYAVLSEGALVVDISREGDKKELPPCIVQKSDGSSNYETTDLATIQWRERELKPDHIIYITDKRQELHFTQVFRCARKCGLVRESTELEFLGNGTINGPDGGPFKTRDGGVPRLEFMVKEIEDHMLKRLRENEKSRGEEPQPEETARQTARITALAALKYGDLSNQLSKDYIYDVERFTASEGDTGPYLLYTMARIKSILRKDAEAGGTKDAALGLPEEGAHKALLRSITSFSQMVESAYQERAPHKVCAFLYQLANDFNSFYHGTKILTEPDEAKKAGYITLLRGVLGIMEDSIAMLGFEAPERM